MEERRHDGMATAQLINQLAALTERLDEQAARLSEQAEQIARQQQEIASLKRDQLKAPVAAGGTPGGQSARRSRRAALSSVLGATAAGALLALSREAAPAHADSRGTIAGTSTGNYGIVASPGLGTTIPSFAGTSHGLVGTNFATGNAPAITSSSGVLGISDTAVGVHATSLDASGVLASSSNNHGVVALSFGTGQTYGVFGRYRLNTLNGSGVAGESTAGATNGVWGQNSSITNGATGVFGTATAASGATIGMWGRSTSGDSGAIGVLGEVTASGAPGIGLKGISPNGPGVYGTSTTAFGVQGLSQNAYGVSGNSTTQAGVWGSSNSNVGVLGTSTSGVGVNGVSVSSNGVNALSASGIGIYASSPSGQAGRFDGDVVIYGNLTVSGSFPHTAAVPSSDGTLRRLYSLESAEAFYEDVGQGSLTNGVGTVMLDPEFAALVLGDTYHVFLTPRGDCNGIYISSQGPTGFEVRELRGGTSNVGFSFRLLARPKTGSGTRLDRVTVPPAPAQPKLDRIEPLDVPATLRETHHPDKPHEASGPSQPAGPPSRVREDR